MSHIEKYFDQVARIAEKIDYKKIEAIADGISNLRDNGGRLFILGVGGSAGNCSHAVNDFRKIVGIESYAPTDNVSELTARTNDEGWNSVFVEWLKVSKLNRNDLIFVFSVGGGNVQKKISVNLVEALKYGKTKKCNIVGVVGKDGGYTASVSSSCLIIPIVNNKTITPHTEAFQAVVWHLIVSHPELKSKETKWESISKK